MRRGDLGVIVGVYDNGRLLGVEIPKDDGTSVGFVDLEVGADGSTKVVGYAVLSQRQHVDESSLSCGPTPQGLPNNL
jgi:hypothetical protein